MSFAKSAVAGGLIAVALIVSACGIQAKPVAGTAHTDHAPGSHAVVLDPQTPYLHCLRDAGFHVTQFLDGAQKLPAFQINTQPDYPTVVFEPTPGIAQGDQIKGEAPGAEVIGAALVYPNHASDATMAAVENCVSVGVKG